jgi:signal transduction histidine kinase
MHAVRTGRLDTADPLLGVVLAVEASLLLYVLERRLEAPLLLSRAVAYAVLSLAVAGAAALGFRALGYPLDPTQLGLTVLLALFAAVLFLGLGELLRRGVEAVLFPDRARLARQVEAARSEAALLRRRVERLERLAVAGELAAQVAHEIKNPLAALRGYAELLAESPSAEQRNKAVRVIREESDRINERVSSLLRLARPARPAPRPAPLELNRVVLEAVAVVEGEPGLPPVKVELDPRAGRVAADADELRGALLNLLQNAAEAAGAHGAPVEVRTRAAGGRVRVEVRDAGPGLPPEVAARPFEAFRTTKPQGTGLGLVIARSAVEAAGGALTLRNREDGLGALAEIELPGVEDEAAVASPAPLPVPR